jgi:outer membrane protein assembly factor BamA
VPPLARKDGKRVVGSGSLRVGLALLLTLGNGSAAFAQEPEQSDEPEASRLEPAVLPALSADSDVGFGFGAFTQFTRFEPERSPYAWRLQVQGQMSVKRGPEGAEFPIHDHYVDLDHPQLFGKNVRVYGRLGYEKNIIAGWYGLGNAATSNDQGIDRRFQFRRAQPILRLKARFPLLGALSTFVALKGRYVTTGTYAGSKLAEDIAASENGSGERLFGLGDHALVELQSGLIWDSRDDETSPQRGSFHEASWRASPGALTGADHDYMAYNVSTRTYVALAGEALVFAFRLTGDLQTGNVPFYLLGLADGLDSVDALGGKKGVRGVPSRRYNGKVKVFGNAELRSTFHEFSIAGDRFALGASAFFDAGRVWYELESRPELDGRGLGLHYGVGGGPQVLWGEALVIRLDAAYSPDADPIGFYLEADRAF